MTDPSPQSDLFSLAGRRALVIGGSSGIGREIALGYRKAGADVLIVGRDEDKLARTAADFGYEKGTGGYAVDVRSIDAIKHLAERVTSDHGTIDILVNCQGTTAIKPAFDLTEEEYDAILDTNLKSVYFACVIFALRMRDAGGGSIVNITSLAAHTGWANAAAYCASKSGVAGLTQTFAAEWGGYGIRVNAISPGFFLTDLNRDKLSPERIAEGERRSAMKRFGELPELVGAAVYLASDASRFVSGTVLRVDGGYLASGI